ncbi:nucleoporin Nup37 isoform X3 [Stegostoma tigrinum]|uniref:nucleoporin Nup37 isoform X3 n=1 Tax=Stegostoma tigrinum TaxID=3053191 RepID=UPI00202AE8B8|nr:nucleoporin Nup37 isoform X3 [Stegostoma tigrinum]
MMVNEAASRGATHTVPTDETVHVVEFNPFEDCGTGSLVAYGGDNYIVVGSCRFQEEDAEIKGMEFKTLQTFHRGIRVDSIAWSPETKMDTLTQLIQFCTADADRNLRLLTSDLKENTRWQLMVAQKNGIIRFYDLVTLQAILSLDCGQMPLMSADWCLGNTIKVGAVAGNDWLIWDITRSSYPQEKRPSHLDGARQFRWSKANENLFATTGYPGKMNSQLLVHHLGHPQAILFGSAPVASGLSWHRTLPLCAVGGDRKVLFWMTEM